MFIKAIQIQEHLDNYVLLKNSKSLRLVQKDQVKLTAPVEF